ncbi:MAG: L-threonylcarbamoyladenylate synthase [Planctomycetota bacterium]|jgi:protein-tyrosine phosphatase
MATEVLRVADQAALHKELTRAGEILRAGGLVAFPTETVYGIAVSEEHPEAVERLYRLKGRPRSKPMTTMVADMAEVFDRCTNVSPTARALMRRFWPGPLTIVLPGEGGRMHGFRLPSRPLARGLVREAGVPLLVPSANISGQPPATTAEEVLRQFPSELDLVIDGGPAEAGIASTVVQVVGDRIEILREGSIPESRLRDPHGGTILFVCQGNTDRSPLAVALLRRRLARHLGLPESELEARGYRIRSAGIAAEAGKKASLNARRVAQEWEGEPLDLSSHRAVKLTGDMVESASRIFCMERDQREQILAFYPERERDVLLVDPEGRDIADPAGSPLAEYRRLAKRLDAAAALILWTLVRTAQ